jgi:hypothetical protein
MASLGEIEMSQIKQRLMINASEVGEFVYCAKAWHLKRCGAHPQSRGLSQGTIFHKKHETTVAQAARLRTTGSALSLIGLFLLIAMAMIRFSN